MPTPLPPFHRLPPAAWPLLAASLLALTLLWLSAGPAVPAPTRQDCQRLSDAAGNDRATVARMLAHCLREPATSHRADG